MFLQTNGSTKIDLGEGFICHLPPPSDPSQIINYGLPREEQYWKRQPLPDYYQERSIEEEYKRNQEYHLVISGQKKAVTYCDPILERYRRREWHRRMFGVWFYNDGVPTYITNHHYWYLQWCRWDHKENDGYPFYYEYSKNNFYIRQWCEENPRSLGYLFVGPRAGGKCLGIGTKVMMYDGGFKNVEDVVVGDRLMGPDSKPRNVLSIATGKDDLYEIVQNRGVNYVVNSEHILSLKRNTGASFVGRIKRGKYKRNYPDYGNICNMNVLEFKNKSQSFKNIFSGYKVGVTYEKKDIEINPYFLGLWLGDGHAAYPIITTMDKEIVMWLDSYCKSIGQKLSKHNSLTSGKASGYCLSKEGARTNKNPLLDTMRKMNLIKNKHIPENYLYNTREVRLMLLAGLIDTDGSFSKGRYEITQVRKPLADQILILCNGLGFRARMHEKIVNGTSYYRVGFSGKVSLPVLLDRKKNRGIPNKDNLVTRIDEINHLGRGEYFGFVIDGDHLFCLEDGTVTHNTNEEIACITNRATMFHHHRAALQSKHFENDAKGVLIQAKTVPLFNRLPSFFKPQFSHGTNPQETLVFTRPAIKGKISRGVEFGRDQELNSIIFAAQPGEKALDTETLSDILEDEVGKQDPKKVGDVYVRHEVNMKCVFRNHRKIGIDRKTTTVEEMNEGGDECHKIWKEADPKVIDGNGYTTAKIHRHLISALDTDTSLEEYIDSDKKNWGIPCDKFGRVDRQISALKIKNDREAVKHDLKKLSSRMRKSPINETEAFIKDQSKSIFNIQILSNRLNQIRNEMTKPPYVTGNLYWLKEKFGPVGFAPDEHAGRFNWAWFPDEYRTSPTPDNWKFLNNFKKEWAYNKRGKAVMMPFPKNVNEIKIATDPIQFSRTVDPRASKSSIHGFRMYDSSVDHGKPKPQWKSHNFIFEYINRPDDPEIYCEDLAMACFFLGAKVLPERNIKTINSYFEQNGLDQFLAYPKDFIEGIGLEVQTDSTDAGYASTTEVINEYTSKLIAFINEHGMRMPFDRTIEDWMNFDPNKITQHDPTVSSGFALIHSWKVHKEEAPVESNISEWFDPVDNTGTVGVYIDSQNN